MKYLLLLLLLPAIGRAQVKAELENDSHYWIRVYFLRMEKSYTIEPRSVLSYLRTDTLRGVEPVRIKWADSKDSLKTTQNSMVTVSPSLGAWTTTGMYHIYLDKVGDTMWIMKTVKISP